MHGIDRDGCFGFKNLFRKCRSSLCLKLLAVGLICFILCLSCYFVETRRSYHDSNSKKEIPDQHAESNSERLIQLIKNKKTKDHSKEVEDEEESSGYYADFSNAVTNDNKVDVTSEREQVESIPSVDNFADFGTENVVRKKSVADLKRSSIKTQGPMSSQQNGFIELIPAYSESKKQKAYDWAHSIPIIEYDDITEDYFSEQYPNADTEASTTGGKWIENEKPLQYELDSDTDVIVEISEIPEISADYHYFSNEGILNDEVQEDKNSNIFTNDFLQLDNSHHTNMSNFHEMTNNFQQPNQKVDSELSSLLDTIFGSMSHLLNPPVQQLQPTIYTPPAAPLGFPPLQHHQSNYRTNPNTIFASFATQRPPLQISKLPRPEKASWIGNLNTMSYNNILQNFFKNNKG